MLRTSRTISGIAALAAATVATGCGNYVQSYHVQNYSYTPGTAIASKIVSGDTTGYQPQTDPLSPGGDPLAGHGDPLVSDVRAAKVDPLVGRSDALARARTTYGWYWIGGSVQGGQVGIAINGVSVGNYTAPVQITKYLHPGQNTITFTHEPTSGTGLCRVHLTVSNRRPGMGQAPVMIYDTESLNQPIAALPVPGAPAAPGAQSGSDQSGALSAPTDSQTSSGPTVESRTFVAE